MTGQWCFVVEIYAYYTLPVSIFRAKMLYKSKKFELTINEDLNEDNNNELYYIHSSTLTDTFTSILICDLIYTLCTCNIFGFITYS